MLDVTDLLAQLVAAPSVNPMGKTPAADEAFESPLTEKLEAVFSGLGIPTERQVVAPRRDNLLARLNGAPNAPVILFEAHQDTVPIHGMTVEPFGAKVVDGRLFGRGACDVKACMAAMIVTMERLSARPRNERPTIVFCGAVGEEHGFLGAEALIAGWNGGNLDLLPRRPDLAVVGEPTSLDVVVAHKGSVRWRCVTTGRAAHSSAPHLGINAIYGMAGLLASLESWQREVSPTLDEHPLCGRPTLSVGVIEGGASVNVVPDRCVIEIDRRLVPGEDPDTARLSVIEYISPAAPRGTIHEEPFLSGRALDPRGNEPIAERLAAAVSESGAAGRQIGVAFGTDAALYAHVGVPSVVFGPGSIAQAHTADEWVALDEVGRAVDVLELFALNGAV